MTTPAHRIGLSTYWRDHSIVRKLVAAWSVGLTPAGKALTIAGLAAAAAGAGSIAAPIYHVAAMLGGVWLASLLAGWFFRARAAVEVSAPPNATAGTPADVRVTIRASGRRPVLDAVCGVRVHGMGGWHERLLDAARIESGDSAQQTVPVTPPRRGIYGPIDVRCWSRYPFGLFRIPLTRKRLPSLVVYPAFAALAGLAVPMGRRFQPGGIALTSSTGESPEYIGNREYRPGDAVRRIDFRAWARLGKPAVREYQEEYFCRVALVLDTFLASGTRVGPYGHPPLEAAVSLSAAVADVLARGEYIIDLFAAGPELYVFRAGRSIAHFDNILEILAGLDPCRTDPFTTVTPALADELGSITSVVCVLLDWDDARARLARTAVECGCAVKAIVVRDGPTTLPPVDDAVDIIHLAPASVVDGSMETL